jgi:hypothetical protein
VLQRVPKSWEEITWFCHWKLQIELPIEKNFVGKIWEVLENLRGFKKYSVLITNVITYGL